MHDKTDRAMAVSGVTAPRIANEEATKATNPMAILDELSPAQCVVVHMVAEYARPRDIMAAARAVEGGDDITDSWVYSVGNPKQRPERYRAVIDALRADQPLLDAGFRLKKRQRALEIAEGDNDVPNMLAVLDGVERLVGLNPNDPPPWLGRVKGH